MNAKKQTIMNKYIEMMNKSREITKNIEELIKLQTELKDLGAEGIHINNVEKAVDKLHCDSLLIFGVYAFLESTLFLSS